MPRRAVDRTKRRAGRLVACAAALAGAGSVLLAPPAPAAAPERPTADRCPAGQTPVVVSRGGRAVVRRDRRGRVRCQAVRVGRPARPRSSAAGQTAGLADTLATIASADPAALKRFGRRLGSRRAKRLLDVALTSWRRAAGAAAASRVRARAAETKTFSDASGAKGSASFEVSGVDDGRELGFRADLSADVEIDATGVRKLGGDDVAARIGAGRAEVRLSFEDLAQACPTSAGAVTGRLRGKGSLALRVTVDGKVTEVRLAAEVELVYTAKVGEDGRWTTIDGVEGTTVFQIGGTGQSTRTYRARRVGSGFGRDPIFGGSAGVSDAIARDLGQFAPGRGGVFGPRSSWNWERGVSLSDIRSLDNFKAMYAASVANAAAIVAAVEYLRQVALPRAEKRWYDAEACLRFDAQAADGSLRPRGTTNVIGRNARAADGGPVPATLKATGTRTIAPAGAGLPAGGAGTFTLTAPDSGSATWQIVAVSRAGKKTVAGSIPVSDLPLSSIAGTFTGGATNAGVTYAWTGTATFRRLDVVPAGAGPAAVFQLTSGQATVTVSGSLIGSGCSQTGTSTIGLAAQSVWTVIGAQAPFSYQIIAPFLPDPPVATNVGCSIPSLNGTPAGLGSVPVAALQSGDVTALSRTTGDLYAYAGSASVAGPDPGQTESWTWSFTGSP